MDTARSFPLKPHTREFAGSGSTGKSMLAAVRQAFGGPEQLVIQEIPIPEPEAGQVLIEVKAFGVNRAEIYMRKGVWGDVARVSGIECVGEVKADPSGRFTTGEKVAAMVGGMGWSLNGSYAQYTCVRLSNVVRLESRLSWEELAAVPECYATAWACLYGNLSLAAGQILMIRGATSALGQAAVNIAANAGVHVIGTTRNLERTVLLERIGANEVVLEGPELSKQIRDRHPEGLDAVLELVGNTTLLDSLRMVRRHGRVCVAGFLGGGGPISSLEPVFQIPSGVHLSTFASALVLGTSEFPMTEIPFQTIFDRVAAGVYKAKPTQVFPMARIEEAHRLMEANGANGKIVMTV